MVCHVLRYTVFYQTIKKMIDSGAIGDVMSIEACEDVAYWHHAHSFVRGNWRNSETSGPMILNKCCHDMDLLSWMMNKKCKKISSFGSNNHFNKENAPEGATEFCFGGCKVKDSCVYDCEKIYITGKTGVRYTKSFPVHTVTAFSGLEITEEDLYPALQNGPYGRCVYHCDNNVVDHQVVNAEFEDKTTASFQMCSFTNGFRDMKVMGTKGFIYTQDFGNVVTCAKFNPLESDYECVDIRTLTDDFSGHGGGDTILFNDFINMLTIENFTSSTLTSIRTSIQSHLMAFAAEESRVNGGAPVEI